MLLLTKMVNKSDQHDTSVLPISNADVTASDQRDGSQVPPRPSIFVIATLIATVRGNFVPRASAGVFRRMSIQVICDTEEKRLRMRETRGKLTIL